MGSFAEVRARKPHRIICLVGPTIDSRHIEQSKRMHTVRARLPLISYAYSADDPCCDETTCERPASAIEILRPAVKYDRENHPQTLTTSDRSYSP
jgi:hypothetical protein